MQESLAEVKCQLESASSTVERTDQKTGTISAQIEGLLGSKQDTSTPREILHELVMKSTEQSVQLSNIGQLLAYKPEYLNLGQKAIASPDFTTAPLGAPNSHGYSRNAQPPQSNMELSDFHDLWISACTCREFHRGRSYQKSNFYRQSWGPFVFLIRKEICGQHHPGCVLHSPDQLTSSTNLNFSFTGLRSTLSRVVGVSLTLNWKSTEWTIAPALQAYRTVDSRFSPAFQLLDGPTEIGRQLMRSHPSDPSRLVEFLHKLKHRLHMIYMSRSASPLDVDEEGRTFLHQLMRVSKAPLSPKASPFMPCSFFCADSQVTMRAFSLHFALLFTIIVTSVPASTSQTWTKGKLCKPITQVKDKTLRFSVQYFILACSQIPDHLREYMIY